jgi:SH3-like domain-containing protein
MKSQAFSVLNKNKETISAGVFIENGAERFIQFIPALEGVDKKTDIDVHFDSIKNMGGFIASHVAATSKYKREIAAFVVVEGETVAVEFKYRAPETVPLFEVTDENGDQITLSEAFITGTTLNGKKFNIPLKNLTVKAFSVPANMDYGKNKVLNYLLTKAKVPVDKIKSYEKTKLLKELHKEKKRDLHGWVVSVRVGGVRVNVNDEALREAEDTVGMALQ